MRILMISDHADPLAEIGSKEAGGQNIYVFNLAKFLGRFGIHVDVYTRWDRKNKKEIVRVTDNVRIIRVKAGPKRYMPRDNFLNVIDEFADHILKRIEQESLEYDIIDSNYWFSGLIAMRINKKLKIPHVHVFHSIGQVRFETLKKYKEQQADYEFFQKRKAAEKAIVQNATGIISTSPVEKQIIEKIFRVKGGKIRVIPVGIDEKYFRPVEKKRMRKRLGFSERAKIILYVGRIEWRKGLGALLFALKAVIERYPTARLYIIGGGRSKIAKSLEANEIERQRKIIKEIRLGGKVRYLGAKRQRDLFKYYCAADVTVVPSYYEPFGIVPLESMSCGTPVVASKTGGMKYTVLDGVTGYLAKPRDHRNLSQKICLALKKRKDYFREQCVERVHQHFTWDKIAIEHLKYFNQLTSNK